MIQVDIIWFEVIPFLLFLLSLYLMYRSGAKKFNKSYLILKKVKKTYKSSTDVIMHEIYYYVKTFNNDFIQISKYYYDELLEDQKSDLFYSYYELKKNRIK